MKEKINSIISVVGSALTFMVGAFDTTLLILVVFMGLDYITGVMVGRKNDKISSKIGIEGVKKKVIMLIYLMVGVLVDRLLGNGTWVFRTLVSMYLIGNEGISILENGGALGVPLPDKLRQALIQLKGDNE